MKSNNTSPLNDKSMDQIAKTLLEFGNIVQSIAIKNGAAPIEDDGTAQMEKLCRHLETESLYFDEKEGGLAKSGKNHTDALRKALVKPSDPQAKDSSQSSSASSTSSTSSSNWPFGLPGGHPDAALDSEAPQNEAVSGVPTEETPSKGVKMEKSEPQEIAQSPAKDPKIASNSMEAEKKPVIEGGLRDVPTKKSVPLRAIEERSAGQKSEIPTEGAIIPIQTPITPKDEFEIQVNSSDESVYSESDVHPMDLEGYQPNGQPASNSIEDPALQADESDLEWEKSAPFLPLYHSYSSRSTIEPKNFFLCNDRNAKVRSLFFGSIKLGRFLIEKKIDADRVFGLISVAGKPTDTSHFIDSHHIVVIGRIERHGQLFGYGELSGIDIVTGHENIVSSQCAVFLVRSIKEGDSIAQQEGIAIVIQGVEVINRLFFAIASIAQANAGNDFISGLLVGDRIENLVLALGLENRTCFGIFFFEQRFVIMQRAYLGRKFVVGKETVPAHHHTVEDLHTLHLGKHLGAQLGLRGQQLIIGAVGIIVLAVIEVTDITGEIIYGLYEAVLFKTETGQISIRLGNFPVGGNFEIFLGFGLASRLIQAHTVPLVEGRVLGLLFEVFLKDRQGFGIEAGPIHVAGVFEGLCTDTEREEEQRESDKEDSFHSRQELHSGTKLIFFF